MVLRRAKVVPRVVTQHARELSFRDSVFPCSSRARRESLNVLVNPREDGQPGPEHQLRERSFFTFAQKSRNRHNRTLPLLRKRAGIARITTFSLLRKRAGIAKESPLLGQPAGGVLTVWTTRGRKLDCLDHPRESVKQGPGNPRESVRQGRRGRCGKEVSPRMDGQGAVRGLDGSRAG